MDIRSSRWGSVAVLASAVSIIAVAVALLVTSIADVPQAAIVLPVIGVGFAASWLQSGRASRQIAATPVVAPVIHSRAA